MSVFTSLSLWAVVKTVFRVFLWALMIRMAYCLPGLVIDAVRCEDEEESAIHAGAASIDCAFLIFLLAILIKYL